MGANRRFPLVFTLASLVALGALLTRPALAADTTVDPVVPILLSLSIVLGAAKVAGWLSTRLGQPAVLGELIAGIVVGNLWIVGFYDLDWMRDDPTLSVLAELGIIVLLFEVGLESTVDRMRRVGASAFLVALIGVITPFALGWAAGAWLLPGSSPYVHAFLGAVLTATSVGITARVLKDLDATRSIEAQIILGAAVIDDVLGLVILAVVSGVIIAADQGGQGISLVEIAGISAKALGFLGASMLLGLLLSRRLFRIAPRVRLRGILLTSALILRLLLEPSHFDRFDERREHSLESLLHPISTFLVPVFFVLTGLRVDLRTLGEPGVLGLAAVLTAAAWIGKQACSLGILQRGVDRLTVGLGMVPRGEVGLIFANIGATMTIGGERVITPATYAAVVIMVIATTLVTPPALQWSLGRKRSPTPVT